MTDADLTAYADLLADPSNVFIWPAMVATWAQTGEQPLYAGDTGC